MRYKTLRDFFNDFKMNPDAVILREEYDIYHDGAYENHNITAVYKNEEYEIHIKRNKNIRVCGKLKDLLKYKGSGKIESI